MGTPTPFVAVLFELDNQPLPTHKVAAEKLLTDRVMTREELIKIGLKFDKYVN